MIFELLTSDYETFRNVQELLIKGGFKVNY
jgi:hypothetical protein